MFPRPCKRKPKAKNIAKFVDRKLRYPDGFNIFLVSFDLIEIVNTGKIDKRIDDSSFFEPIFRAMSLPFEDYFSNNESLNQSF